MAKKPPYRLLDSRVLHKGHIFTLVKDRFTLDIAPGKIVTRELVKHPGAVVILPLLDRSTMLLIRQFRYAAKGDLWEVPAGTLEPGEATLACAKRELEEETGHRAKKWRLMTRFLPAPGMSDELMTLYLAEELTSGRKNLDHDEWIEAVPVKMPRALAMIRSGSIRDGKTIAAVLYARQFYDNVR